jgi:hypothetical protein
LSLPGKRQRRIIPGYLTQSGVLVVGKYETACGGCDTIKTQDEAKAAVRSACALSNKILFEGVLISTLFQGWLDFSRERRAMGHRFTWAYLDTPIITCLDRIQKRNGGKTINEQLVRDKVRAIDATMSKAGSANEDVVRINHRDAVTQIRRVFGV